MERENLHRRRPPLGGVVSALRWRNPGFGAEGWRIRRKVFSSASLPLTVPAGSAKRKLRWLSHCAEQAMSVPVRVDLSSAVIATRSLFSSGLLPGGQENWPNAQGNKTGIVGDY